MSGTAYGTKEETRSGSDFWNIVKIAGIGAVILIVVFTAISLYNDKITDEKVSDKTTNFETEEVTVIGAEVTTFKTVEKDSSSIAELGPDAMMGNLEVRTLTIYEDNLHFAGFLILEKSDLVEGVSFYFKDSLVEINNHGRYINQETKNVEMSINSYNNFPISSQNVAATQFEGKYILYSMYQNK